MNDIAEVNDKLAMFLRAHGLAVSNQNNWLVIEKGLPSISAEIVREFKYEKCRTVQLDVRVAVDSDTIIIESFAGIGDDTAAAINDAIGNFALSSLHPLLAAFYEKINDHSTIESWQIGKKTWKVILGDCTIKNMGEGQIKVSEDTLSTIERLLNDANLSGNIHWARLYYGHISAENIICEFLLDNNPWELAQDQLSKLDWPNQDEFYSVRLFMIFLREA